MKKSPSQQGSFFKGIVALLCLTAITTLCFISILIIGIAKLFPSTAWRVRCSKMIDSAAVAWTQMTGAYISRFYSIQWTLTGATTFDPHAWYLIIANHQSWLDVVVLQKIFVNKIPTLKFFIKAQLIWVPLLGFSWWAMGCPFMKRHSKAYLEKNPHKKGADVKSTDKALDFFKTYPSTLISFVEGTRFTPQKNQDQQAPYFHLLKPKAGGISQVISSMGPQLHPVIDVTIVYLDEHHSIWDFLCGRITAIHADVRILTLPESLSLPETSLNDPYTQSTFRAWLNDQWAFKDALIAKISREIDN